MLSKTASFINYNSNEKYNQPRKNYENNLFFSKYFGHSSHITTSVGCFGLSDPSKETFHFEEGLRTVLLT
jgi:hypothetical protein